MVWIRDLKYKINYAIFIIEELRDFKRTIPIKI